jgi:hypothetical protein
MTWSWLSAWVRDSIADRYTIGCDRIDGVVLAMTAADLRVGSVDLHDPDAESARCRANPQRRTGPFDPDHLHRAERGQERSRRR